MTDEYTEPTNDELIDIATRMAQEIQELIEDTEAAGCSAEGHKELLEEWEAIWRRTELGWQHKLCKEEHTPSLIDSL